MCSALSAVATELALFCDMRIACDADDAEMLINIR